MARRVVVTRPGEPGARLVAALREAGCETIHLPGMQLAPATDPERVAGELRQRLDADIWVVTSPNAVRFARELAGEDWPAASGPRFAVPGAATADALVQSGVGRERIIRPATGHTSEALLRETDLQGITGLRVVVLNAAGGRDALRRELAARGAVVECLHVYRRAPPQLEPEALRALEVPDSVTVIWTSRTAMDQLRALLPAACWDNLVAGRQVVASARLEREIRALGAGCAVLAPGPDNDSLMEATLAS